jgi:type II secretory pathway component PulF
MATIRDFSRLKIEVGEESVFGLPKSNAIPLALLAVLPGSIWALGIGPALGLMTFAWMANRRDWIKAALMAPAIAGVLVGSAAYYYFNHWANLLLAEPALAILLQ